MKLISLFIPISILFTGIALKIDFGTLANRTTNWVILSDNVMGGLSEAEIKYDSNSVLVTGFVSLKNRGGFVSIKSTFGKLNLSLYKTVKIKFRSTAQKYSFTLENSRRWYEAAYKHEFSTKEINKWETVSLDLTNFIEEVIGEPTGNKTNKNILESIIRIGISTNEKKEGPFQLEIESIEFI